MRTFVFSVVLSLALVATGDAQAKPKGDDLPTITLTTIEQFDAVFSKGKAIETSLIESSKQLTDARLELNKALGVAADAPLKTALEDLKSKAGDALAVTMEGGKPKLSVKDAAPDNVKVAVTAVGKLVDACQAVVDQTKAIPGQVTELSTAATAFPGQLTSIKVDDKMLLMKLPKTLGNNSKALAAFPTRAQELGSEATSILTDVGGLVSK